MNSPDIRYDVIIACVGNNEQDESIINAASKKAKIYNCGWRMLFVDCLGDRQTSGKTRMRLNKKAKILGGEIIEIKAENVQKGIEKYSGSLDESKIRSLFLVGIANEGKIPFLREKHFYRNIGKNINAEPVYLDKNNRKNKTFLSPIFNFNGLQGIIESLIFVLTATVASLLIESFTMEITPYGVSDIYLIYLIACMTASIRGGMIPGLIATVLSLITINFFFLNTFSSFTSLQSANVTNLLTFFITGAATSFIGSSSRRYIIMSRRKEAYLSTLLSIGETLNRPLDKIEALSYIHQELEKLFRTQVAFYLPDLMDNSILSLKYPSEMGKLEDEEKDAFEKCRTEFLSTGHLTSVQPKISWYFEPMMSASGFEGILAVKLADSDLRHDTSITDILLSFAELSATIIDRIERTQILEENRIQDEREKLRTMLLSSVSHDLKTPLASIIGSLDVYHSLFDKLNEEKRTQLIQTAHHEAIRLDSFITNILDMAKLESGSIKFHREWYSCRQIVEKAMTYSRGKLGTRIIRNLSEERDYEIEVDSPMLLRGLANLMDNISKYTPEGSNVSFSYSVNDNGSFELLITDEGPGIEEKMLDEIFNKYTRIKHLDAKVAGTGLGLPITRYIIEANGGNIVAYNNKEKGASFKITLPRWREIA